MAIPYGPEKKPPLKVGQEVTVEFNLSAGGPRAEPGKVMREDPNLLPRPAHQWPHHSVRG